MRLSFDLAVEEENDNTKGWREYFSQRLQAALSQVILTRLFHVSFMEIVLHLHSSFDHSSMRDSYYLRLVFISDEVRVLVGVVGELATW